MSLSKITCGVSTTDDLINNVNGLIDLSENRILTSGNRVKIVAFGDSITRAGDSPRTTNLYMSSTKGYWINAVNAASRQFYLLDGLGVSGNWTQDLLNRITEVTTSSANVVMIMIGTNDISNSVSVNTISSNMESIVDQIVEAGKKVVITPILHRKVSDGFNTTIDLVNSRYRKIAADRPLHVVMCDDPADFNSRVDSGNHLQVTTDGLHPNSYGAWLVGKSVANTLNKSLASRPHTTPNIVPNPSMSGASGVISNGATGQSPDGYTLFYAAPTSGLGGVVHGDGKFTMKTGVDIGGGNGRKATLKTANATLSTNKMYSGGVRLTISDTTNISKVQVLMVIGSVQSIFDVTIPSTGGVGESITYLDNLIQTAPITSGANTIGNLFVAIESNGVNAVSCTVSSADIFEVA